MPYWKDAEAWKPEDVYMAITKAIKTLPDWLRDERLKLIVEQTLRLKSHKTDLHEQLRKRWPHWCNECSHLSDEQKCHRTVPVVQRENWEALEGIVLTCAEEGDHLDSKVCNFLLY